MFTLHIETRTPGLEEAIESLLSELESLTGDDPAYAKTVEQITALHKLKMDETPEPWKPDAAIAVLGNVVIASLILAFERENVITTKLQNFISKAK